MARPLFGAIAATILTVLVSGCQAAPGVVRGQSPADVQTYAPGTYPPGTYVPGTATYPAPPATQVLDANGNVVAGGGNGCPYCGGACRGGFCAAREYYRSTYCVPQNLSYPPPNTPPAVVQYPYYTCKGPDCFFYTGP